MRLGRNWEQRDCSLSTITPSLLPAARIQCHPHCGHPHCAHPPLTQWQRGAVTLELTMSTTRRLGVFLRYPILTGCVTIRKAYSIPHIIRIPSPNRRILKVHSMSVMNVQTFKKKTPMPMPMFGMRIISLAYTKVPRWNK